MFGVFFLMEKKGVKMAEKRFQVNPVGKDQRNLGRWDMFATWFGANANNGTWYIGGIIAACGLVGGFGQC